MTDKNTQNKKGGQMEKLKEKEEMKGKREREGEIWWGKEGQKIKLELTNFIIFQSSFSFDVWNNLAQEHFRDIGCAVIVINLRYNHSMYITGTNVACFGYYF